MYVDKIVAIRFELPNLFSLGHHPSTSLKYPILQTTCLLPAVFDATLLCCSDYAQIDRKLNTENSNRGKDTRVGGAKEGRSCPPDHWRAGGLELTGYFATSSRSPHLARVSYSRPAHRYRRKATSSLASAATAATFPDQSEQTDYAPLKLHLGRLL